MFCLNSLFPPAQEITTSSSVFPSFFYFSIFSSASYLADCSLSAIFSSSASSLPPYLLIFLTRTVVISSAAAHPSPWRHSSWRSVAPSFRRVSDLLFCLPMCCSFLLSVLPPLSYFLLIRFPVKSNPFCSIENQMGLQRISSCIYELPAASRQVLCHVLYPKGGNGSQGYQATKAPFCQIDDFCRI